MDVHEMRIKSTIERTNAQNANGWSKVSEAHIQSLRHIRSKNDSTEQYMKDNMW